MSRLHSHPPSQRLPRRGLWPVALLCALAYLGAATHFALVQHATCAAHGELVHAAETPEQVLPAERFADARVAAPEQAVDADHEADAHCASALSRRELPGSSDSHVRAERSGAVAVLAPAGPAPDEQVERLHLAPKASPPRA